MRQNTKATRHKMYMRSVAKVTLMLILFAVVFAGTLSGAFGVESLSIKNASVDINGNIQDSTVGVADAAGIHNSGGQTIELADTFKDVSYSVNINPDVSKRGGLYTTNTNHINTNTWTTGNGANGYWAIGNSSNLDLHSGGDSACAWFLLDLGENYTSKVDGDITITWTAKYTRDGDGSLVLAIESSNSFSKALPTSAKNNTWYEYLKGRTNGSTEDNSYLTKTEQENSDGEIKESKNSLMITHTVKGRYIRIHFATWDGGSKYNRHKLENLQVTLTRRLAYNFTYNKNGTNSATLLSNSGLSRSSATVSVSGTVNDQKLAYHNTSGVALNNSTITSSFYKGNGIFFDSWNTASNGTGSSIGVGGTTGTLTTSGVGKTVTDNLKAGTLTTTLYARYKNIPFSFNGQDYSYWDNQPLTVIKGTTGYLTSTVSGYTTSITYSSGASAPTTVGDYTATITVKSGSQERGTVTISFKILDGDFEHLSSGVSGEWGSATNPYVISTPQHLVNLANIVNGTAQPLNSVKNIPSGNSNASNSKATSIKYENCYFVITANLTMGSDFVPVGKNNTNYFAGTVYGGDGIYSGGRKQVTITVNINMSGTSNVGVFGYVWKNSATDRPTFDHITINGTVRGGGNVGGLIGWGQDATLISCVNNASVTGSGERVGGLIGYSFGTEVQNGCQNTGAVSGTNYVGGIAGRGDWGNIQGTNGNPIKNTGTVSGNNYVGGIVGEIASYGTLQYVENTANVTAQSVVGGIVGYANSLYDQTVAVSNSKNSGTITATGAAINLESKGNGAYLGGIVGFCKAYIIKNCKNDGTVTTGSAWSSSDHVGGIVGHTLGNVQYCYNSAEVLGCSATGGIVGYVEGGIIEYCYFDNSIQELCTNAGATAGFIYGAKGSGTVRNNFALPNATYVNASNVTYNKDTVSGEFVTLRYEGQNRVVPVVGQTEQNWDNILTANIDGVKLIYNVGNGQYLNTNAKLGADDIVTTFNNSFGSAFDVTFYCRANDTSLHVANVVTHEGKNVVRIKISTLTIKMRAQNGVENSYDGVFGNRTYDGNVWNIKLQGQNFSAVYEDFTTSVKSSVYTNYDNPMVNGTLYDTNNTVVNEIKNAGKYTAKYTVAINGKVVGAISSAEIEIQKATLNVSNFYYQLGIVANNGDGSTINDKKSYPLSRVGDTTIAFVYQNGEYIVDNFIVNGSGETLHWERGNSSMATTTEGNFVVYIESGKGGLDGGYVTDWSQMQIDGNHEPVTFTLRFESKNSNYQFATDSNQNKIVFTLLNSDFGVLDGKSRDSSWGSQDNPYIISTSAHLLRLSQIVNGAQPWDSIKSFGGVGIANSRSYAGTFFRLTANVTVTDDMGFVPIGAHSNAVLQTLGGTGYEPKHSKPGDPFAGTFEGAWHDSTGANDPAGPLYKVYININPSSSNIMDYVGLFGYIDGATIRQIAVENRNTNDRLIGNNYVGGIAGYALNSTIEDVSVRVYVDQSNGTLRGVDYVGGIVGYAENTTIKFDNSQDRLALIYGQINSTGNYAGLIAGYWKVTDQAQLNTNGELKVGTTGVAVYGKGFVGGLVGYLNAEGCHNGIVVKPYLTAGANSNSNITVSGSEFVGSLFGVFVGGGYKQATNYASPTDSILEINADNISTTVSLRATTNVMGGLFGLVAKTAVRFVGNYVSTDANAPVKFSINNQTVNFVGILAGIIGENATFENVAIDETDGRYYQIQISTNMRSTTINNFVGSVAGYVSQDAGIYYGESGTLFGNKLIVLINGITIGNAYVGGVFGAMGKLATSLIPSMTNTVARSFIISVANRDVSTIMTYGPQTEDYGLNEQPFGRVANVNNVEAKGNYAGGFVGAVLDGVRLELINPQYTTESGISNLDAPYSVSFEFRHTPIYNGDVGSAGANNNITISGANYVGGIAGYLGDAQHTLTRVVSRALVGNSSNTSQYVGGLVGEMNGGSINNSMSIVPRSLSGLAPNNGERNAYRGTKYVGGIVGNLVGGTVKGSVSTGMQYTGSAQNNSLIGGVAGDLGLTASVEGSWAIVIGNNLNATTTMANKHGKFILIDSKIAYSPAYAELAKTIGLYDGIGISQELISASTPQYGVETGYISVGASVPSEANGMKNKQLVFYDGGGNDRVTTNDFNRGAYEDLLENQNNIIRIRLGAYGDQEQDSMVICVADIVFKNVAPCHDGDNTATGKANAAAGYRKPSNSTRYSADVTGAEFTNTGHNVSRIVANILFNGALVGTTDNSTKEQVGSFDSTFDVGSSANPFIIASQDDWNDFASSIQNGKNNYSGQYVKLMTSGVTVTKDNVAGLLSYGEANTLPDQNHNFQGEFDGNGHTITIDVNTASDIPRLSVFPNAGGSGTTTIRNLTIKGNAKSTSYDIAAFVGKPFGTLEIINCTNNATVQGFRNVGGFVGCTNEKTVEVTACVNNGTISSTEEPSFSGIRQLEYEYGTGGIIGQARNDLTISSCMNTGSISSTVNVGGICGTAYKDTTLTIKDCANTGSINSTLSNTNKSWIGSGTAGTNVWSFAGGMVGFVGETVKLELYRCYNSGTIRGIGNCIGGLVGTIGSFTNSDDGKPGDIKSTKKSIIEECYNIGNVFAGGSSAQGGVNVASGWGYTYTGTCVGGLIGVASSVAISDCYNAGTVTAYGCVGVAAAWHQRAGGIIGDLEARSSTYNTTITRTFNIGQIVNAESSSTDCRYGAGIIGCSDNEKANLSIDRNSVFSIANQYRYNGNKYRTEGDMNYVWPIDISKKMDSGTVIGGLEEITAYYSGSKLAVSSTVGAVTTIVGNSKWQLVYGCLPQLKCFVLDTQQGLSMNSQGYGVDEYGEYTNVMTTAGSSADNPYIIKDGIDLLGLSALSMGGDTFANKYIAFANKTNNYLGQESKVITMPNSDTVETTAYTASGVKGKSYHLFEKGAVRSKNYNSDTDIYTNNWMSNNRMYDATTGENNKSGTHLYQNNIHAIGTNSAKFKGTITGKQADGTNTKIANLRVNASSAGLFGYVDGANISYITTSGVTNGNAKGGINGRSNAGGLVGYSTGDCVIDHCNSDYLDIKNYGESNYDTGGIVGYIAGNTTISNCKFVQGWIDGGQYIGGIAGRTVSGNVDIINCEVQEAGRIKANPIDGENNTLSSNIGGILGLASATKTNIKNCTVGDAGKSVNITGTYGLGGIVGTASKNVLIDGATIGAGLKISRNNQTANHDTYGTAIGGLVGAGADITNGLSIALSGTIEYEGNIEILNSTGETKNVGSLIGYMGSGSRFMAGSNVVVGGTVTINCAGARQNIGGVAGITKDVVFSGDYSVSSTLNVGNANSVGGFIGRNEGETVILADGTTVTIGCTINAGSEVGGFIGNNSGSATLRIGPDSYQGLTYLTGDVDILIGNGTRITATGNNVGGLVGLNEDGSGILQITKGDIINNGTISAQGDNVGGVVGNNSAGFSLGGSLNADKKLTITNNGSVSGRDSVGGIIGLFNNGTMAGVFTNNGNVTATGSYAGGSIGYMGASASIVATNAETTFINGGNATAQNDALVAADRAVTTADGASVDGHAYVGGSIGYMLGTIEGNNDYRVVFENNGQVDGDIVVGGSVGLISGVVIYATFINASGDMQVSAANVVGGSVGIIMMYRNENSITHTHFEFVGELTVGNISESIDNGLSKEEQIKNNGVGGSIGVISAQGDNVNFTWADNTFYNKGNVTASNNTNVGGTIGSINAKNITISNMLAYETSIVGSENVGGIVGASYKEGTVIDNAFNVRGLVSGKNAGGIIGLAYGSIDNDGNLSNGATDASTSYWVKQESNSNLEKADIKNLKGSLGKTQSVTLNGVALTSGENPPVDYIDAKIDAVNNGEQTATQAGIVKSFADNAQQMVQTTTYETTVVFGGIDAQGKNISVAGTIRQVFTEHYETWTNYDEVDENGNPTVVKSIIAKETVYTYIASDGSVLNLETESTWKDVLNQENSASGIVFTYSNGFFVYATNNQEFTTGVATTGWYFVYAATSGREGSIDALHGINGVEDEVADLQAWKRIANAYTSDERESGADKDSLSSNIVYNDNEIVEGTVYATATAGRGVTEGNVKSNYYLYVATSSGVLPVMVQDESDLFYISVLANSNDTRAENIAVFYRKLQAKNSITYNGYERVAPVTDEVLKGRTYEQPGYYYSDKTVGALSAGKYSSNIQVSFKNGDTVYIVGEDYPLDWEIKAKEVTVTTKNTNNSIYGDENKNYTEINAVGISTRDTSVWSFEPKDKDGNTVSTQSRNPFTFVISVNDNFKIYIRANSSGGGIQISTDINNWDSKNVAMSPDQIITLTDGENISVDLQVDCTSSTESFKSIGSEFTKNNAVDTNTKWQQLKIKLKFKNVAAYRMNYSLANEYSSKDYKLKADDATINVKPRELTVKIQDKSPIGIAYDGQEHGTTWKVEGWAPMDVSAGLVAQYFKEWASSNSKQGVVACYNGKEDSSLKLSFMASSYTITLDGAVNVGEYALKFAGTKKTEGLVYNNYVFKLSGDFSKGALDANQLSVPFEIGQVKIFITKYGAQGSHEYDGSTVGEMSFEFQVRDGVGQNGTLQSIEHYIATIENYYSVATSTNITDKTFKVQKINDTTARATFKTDVNAKNKYNVTLQVSSSINDQEANCVADKESSHLTSSYIIEKRSVNFGYTMTSGGSGNKYTYNTEHQGIDRITFERVVDKDKNNFSITFTVAEQNGWSCSVSKYTGTNAVATFNRNATTSDVGNYYIVINSVSNSNYQIGSNSTGCTWTITPKELNLNVDSSQSVYYDGTIKNPTVKIAGLSGNKYGKNEDVITLNFVVEGENKELKNAGKYNLTYDTSNFAVKRGESTVGANGVNLTDNYTVVGGTTGSVEYTINKARLSLTWKDETFTYNGNSQGLILASAQVTTEPTGQYVATENGTKFVVFGDDIKFTLSGKQTNAGTYTMSATINASGSSQFVQDNYEISNTTKQYTINKAVVSVSGMSGIATSKVYDATASVNVSNANATFGGSTKPARGNYDVTAIYNSATVDATKIICTITLNSSGAQNFEFAGGTNTATFEINGTITPRQLTVMLDKLRNGKATKSFDDTVFYGGQNGFVFRNSEGHSAIYRSGEGFVVTGFGDSILQNEIAEAIKIVAKYVETTDGRTEFDKFINNVEKSGNTYIVNADDGYYKSLVFTLSGDKGKNYTFVVNSGESNLAISSNGVATVFDANDSKKPNDANGISIEITVKSLKANYSYTSQSYANADNTYNTDWIKIVGAPATQTADGIQIVVANGWMSENGQPKVYDKYTVIRGRADSEELGANIKEMLNGLHINYKLSNQPILTIGYFIDSDAFEIGSLASLMIATYYQTVFANSGNPDFNMEIIGNSTWHFIVSESGYENSTFDKSKVDKIDNITSDEIDACETWDDFFALLESKGYYVFINNMEAESGWGYYTVSEDSTQKKYSSFKQVANVSGIMTEEDIAILDSFFTLYTYAENGTPTQVKKEWGLGGQYIQNFVKVEKGSVVIAIGSIFADVFGDACVYDGNGYTIDHFNIIATDKQNVGMFASIASGGSVKNVHLRNFNIIANGVNGQALNVGGIAGESNMANALENSSFHGSIRVNGNGANVAVGGLFGKSSTAIDGAIVLGNIDVENTTSANVGGVVGANSATLKDIVSMIEIYADGNVGGVAGNNSASSANNVFYMKDATWTKKSGTLTVANGSVGTAKTYGELFAGSNTGYGTINPYYAQDADTGKGVYDMLDNTISMSDSNQAPRESMRLRDIVDVYLLMYTLSEKSGAEGYSISATSWLVGNRHGSSEADAIIIANQQGVSLLREFRFATFVLVCDVEMYSTHDHSVFDGAFYGNVVQNDYKITLYANQTMFEQGDDKLPLA